MGDFVTDYPYACQQYKDCPADAFSVTLPPTAFLDLHLPNLDTLEIFDLHGPGKLVILQLASRIS